MVLTMEKNHHFFILTLSGLQNDLYKICRPFSIFKAIGIKKIQILSNNTFLEFLDKFRPNLP